MQRWIIDDGIVGHYRQSQALAQHLGGWDHIIQVPWLGVNQRWRQPWAWIAPDERWVPKHWSRQLPRVEQATLLIACGRHAAQVALLMQQQQPEQIETAQILNPRRHHRRFTRIIAPLHDALSGENIVTTLGAIHHIDESSLTRAAEYWAPHWQDLPRPHIGVLLGGGALGVCRQRWQAMEVGLSTALAEGGSYLFSSSRRTPKRIQTLVEHQLSHWPGFAHWVHHNNATPTDEYQNPYLGILALADELWISIDSVNMISEALSCHNRVHIRGQARRRKERAFIRQLTQLGYIENAPPDVDATDTAPPPTRLSGVSTVNGVPLRDALPVHWSSKP